MCYIVANCTFFMIVGSVRRCKTNISRIANST
nr:MAG TPA: hypothetical protein [Caudoviricetes sp.]